MKAIFHKSYVSTWMQASAYGYTLRVHVCVCVLENGIAVQIMYMSF